MAKKVLGRGLSSIFNENPELRKKSMHQTDGKAEEPQGEIQMIRISAVEPNKGQPRKSFDQESLSELADSIKRFGIIQPLILQKQGRGYRIIAGERRWRAARLAGLKEVPAIIRDLKKEDAAEIALIENIQREDLGPLEEAMAYKELVEAYGLTQEEVAEKVSKSRAAVANSLRLLQLPAEVLELLSNGSLSAGHARCLITIPDTKAQLLLAKEIAQKGLSVRETEKRATAYKKQTENDKKETGKKLSDKEELLLRDLEKQLCEGLNTRVHIRASSSQKGRIEIEYYSVDELNRISDLLR